jgi:murein DD-endopeptidase MepM/ murein hydrolase activator NlpD
MNLLATQYFRMVLVALILFITVPCVAGTTLVINRQSLENTVSIETTIFGPVQVELLDSNTGAVLFDGILEGPGLFSISDLPKFSINHLTLQASPGPPSQAINFTYQIPFSSNADWTISQGYQGNASHNDAANAFAVDFDIPIGTPVLAARAGVVMEVIDNFSDNGSQKKSNLGQANLIRILHEDGSMAVYGHLLKGSALVNPGQWLMGGTVIAQSGNSGYTFGPHLHFAIQINQEMQLASIPFLMKSVNGYIELNP